MGAGTTTMQSICSPIAWYWDGMHSIKSKAYSSFNEPADWVPHASA